MLPSAPFSNSLNSLVDNTKSPSKFRWRPAFVVQLSDFAHLVIVQLGRWAKNTNKSIHAIKLPFGAACAPFSVSIPNIVYLRAKPQVKWVTAGRIVTAMKHLVTFRDTLQLMPQKECDSMRAGVMTVESKVSITRFVSLPAVFPAFMNRLLRDLVPKCVRILAIAFRHVGSLIVPPSAVNTICAT